jgi:hypothetical protein
MERAQIDMKMDKGVKIENMADGGDVMVRERETCGMKTKLGFLALVTLVLAAIFVFPTSALALQETLYPDGAGSTSGWTWSGGSTNWSNFSDHDPHDGDTTHAYAGAKNLVQTVSVEDTSVGVGGINYLRVYANCKIDAGGDENVGMVARESATDNASAGQAMSESYALHFAQWDTRPVAGGAWTWTDINALEIGVKTIGTSGWGSSINEYCTNVYAVVDYTPEIDTLSVSINNAVATTAQGKQTGVLMQTMGVDSDTAGNSNAVINSVTVNDMGIATDGDWANLHIYVDDDQSVANGVLGTTTTADWDGTFTTVDITNMSPAVRTVTNPTTKYIHFVYDLNESAGDKSVQSRVAEINVEGTDIGAFNAWSSNSFPITMIRDTLSFISNTPVASTADPVNEGDPGVLMQHLAVSCDNPQDGDCVITSVKVNELGSAYNGDIIQSYVHMDDDTNFVNGTLGTTEGGSWNGGAKNIDITGMPLAARTVTNAEGTQYIWVVFDLANDTGEETIQSSIVEVNVADPDIGIKGTYNSNYITISDIDDQLSMTASTVGAVTVTAEDTGVLMQTTSVDCDYNADGQCAMTTVTVDDTGTAGTDHWTNMYLYVDDDSDHLNGVISTDTYSNWSGGSTDVPISRTVTNGDTDYIHIVYDIAAGAIYNTMRSQITSIAVSAPDLGASGPMRSNPITVQPNADVDTINTCADCHNMPILDGTRSASPARGGSRALGNHASVVGHMPASPVAADCAVCHADHGTNMKHRDGIVNMASLINSGTYSKGTSFVQNASDTTGTCNNTECHGITSDSWGTDLSAYDTCTKCHGTKTANPATWQLAPGNGGVDTAGDSLPTDPQVGAHYEHLATPLNTAAGVTAQCETCHLRPANVFDAGHVDNGAPADMNYNAFVTNAGNLSPSRSNNTCLQTYCHGNNMPGGSSDGLDTEPDWLDAAYLTGTDMDWDCSRCHGFPPKGYGGEHESMSTGAGYSANCRVCHTYLNDPKDDDETGWKGGNAFAEPKRHINGRLEVTAACDGCHGYPPSANDGHAYLAVEGKGVHESHVDHLEVAYGVIRNSEADLFNDATVLKLCMACHFGADHEQTDHDSNNDNRTIAFNNSLYQFGTNAPSYGGVQNSPGVTNPKTCSNNSCHYITSPEWEEYP